MIKLFISHASEDKANFVEPLVIALRKAGFDVWYDKYELTIGDSLRQKIDDGLKECDFGIVVLSPHFFAKKWTGSELDGLMALETANRKLILPIWKDVTEEDVKEFSPMLAGKLGAPASGGIEAVVGEIRRAVDAAQRTAVLQGIPAHRARLDSLEEKIASEKRAQTLAHTPDGVRIAHDAASGFMKVLSPELDELVKSRSVFQLQVEPSSATSVGVKCPYRMKFSARYNNSCVNSIDDAELRLLATQSNDPWGDDPSKFHILHSLKLRPVLTAEGEVTWKGERPDCEFNNRQLVDCFLNTLVDLLEAQHAKHSKNR